MKLLHQIRIKSFKKLWNKENESIIKQQGLTKKVPINQNQAPDTNQQKQIHTKS